jgi:hypothetical protein
MMTRRKPTVQPIRCSCEGGGDRAKEHGKPGAKAADHGDPFAGKKGCIHSELQHTTKRVKKARTVQRLRLQ